MSQEAEKPKFDPSKRYVWDVNEKFTFSAQEFGFILNSLREILSTEQARTIFLAQKTSEIIEKALIKGVEEGRISEDNKEKSPVK